MSSGALVAADGAAAVRHLVGTSPPGPGRWALGSVGMSEAVAETELAERVEEYGPIAYLVTVRPEGRPHAVSVRVSWDGGDLVVGAGHRTSANVTDHPDVTLLWAAPPGRGYSLIVDGTARPDPGEAVLRIQPKGAVLHRTPEGDPAAPSCITVLARH